MEKLLYKIPLSTWVRKTIKKMDNAGVSDMTSWGKYWFEVYKELGGMSENSGKKECPKIAAYSLWKLGKVGGYSIPRTKLTLFEINECYGKNAAYALLALDLLIVENNSMDIKMLWAGVRKQYRKRLGKEPSKSEQGAVKVTKILYDEGHIK